jgi:hypothetical protein
MNTPDTPIEGVTYILAATGYVEGLTHGNLEVMLYIENVRYSTLSWSSTDTSPTTLRTYVKLLVTPALAEVYVTGANDPNVGALLHIDKVIFERYTDYEMAEVGSAIATYGSMPVVPDVEVQSLYMVASNTTVSSQTIYNSGVEEYSSAATAYVADTTSLEKTMILLGVVGHRIRVDEVFTNIGTHQSGTTASMRVTIQSSGTSLFNGVETRIAEWSDSTHIPPDYNSFALDLNLLAGLGEGVTFRFYLKTSNANIRASSQKMGYKFSMVTNVPVSGGISIYNDRDRYTIMRLCNTLRPLTKIGLNANYTGYIEYSDRFIDDTFLESVSVPPVNVSYNSTDRTVSIATGGSLTYKFDARYPVTGLPFAQIFVVSGTLAVSISLDGTNWHACDGTVTTAYSNQSVPVSLNNENDHTHLKGNSIFYVRIAPNTTGCVLRSIFIHADLNTIDCERITLAATEKPETIVALLDAPANAIITLKYRDNDPVI